MGTPRERRVLWSRIFQFAGYYFHAASGLSLTLYRPYDPGTGRWLSRDPVGENGGINLYDYVGNNPISGRDPLGLWNLWNPLTWGLRRQPGENPLNPFNSSAEWSATRSGAVAGAEAFAGGVFGLDSAGCDRSLQLSQSIGSWTRNIEISILATEAVAIYGPATMTRAAFAALSYTDPAAAVVTMETAEAAEVVNSAGQAYAENAAGEMSFHATLAEAAAAGPP